MRLVLAALVLASTASTASATTITFELPGNAKVERQAVSYKCGDRDVKVEYINAGSNSLAVLTIGDETIIAVTVLSGSGAKYAGQHYVWWTKGAHADLYDLTKGEDAPPLSCAAAG
jgi:membrane-bound inhibitor of C-type lysozyme